MPELWNTAGVGRDGGTWVCSNGWMVINRGKRKNSEKNLLLAISTSNTQWSHPAPNPSLAARNQSLTASDIPVTRWRTDYISSGGSAPNLNSKVPCCDLDQDRDCPDWTFHGSPQSLQANAGILPLNRPRLFPSISIPFNHLLFILAIDVGT
jgi:hypothetical protein